MVDIYPAVSCNAIILFYFGYSISSNNTNIWHSFRNIRIPMHTFSYALSQDSPGDSSWIRKSLSANSLVCRSKSNIRVLKFETLSWMNWVRMMSLGSLILSLQPLLNSNNAFKLGSDLERPRLGFLGEEGRHWLDKTGKGLKSLMDMIDRVPSILSRTNMSFRTGCVVNWSLVAGIIFPPLRKQVCHKTWYRSKESRSRYRIRRQESSCCLEVIT